MLPKPERTELHASYQDLLLPTTLRLLDIQAHRLAARADNLPLRAIELTVHALRRFTTCWRQDIVPQRLSTQASPHPDILAAIQEHWTRLRATRQSSATVAPSPKKVGKLQVKTPPWSAQTDKALRKECRKFPRGTRFESAKLDVTVAAFNAKFSGSMFDGVLQPDRSKVAIRQRMRRLMLTMMHEEDDEQQQADDDDDYHPASNHGLRKRRRLG
ncbi:hypothetical protein LTS02_003593 [Friedmanniomyces endolithicus]|nr:hypothetical protein LTS02_003593 [Friedmanniomyces endolithicus]